MSEKEKKILESITKAVPNMSEFDKGYFLGVGETIAKYKNADKTDDSGKTQKEVRNMEVKTNVPQNTVKI